MSFCLPCFLDPKINFRICFVKLKLLLVAIEEKDKEDNDAKISINPRQATTPGYTIGYFWAQSAEEVKRYLILICQLNALMPFAGPTFTAMAATKTSRMRT